MGNNVTAYVEVLTAEVRTLMIGNRQVTLSVFKQLDIVPASECEPFGRVCNGKDDDVGDVWAVGRHCHTAALIRARRRPPEPPGWFNHPTDDPNCKWFSVGITRREFEFNSDGPDRYYSEHGQTILTREEYNALPAFPRAALIAARAPYKVQFRIPYNSPVNESIRPGGWTYTSPDAEREALDYANNLLNSVHSAATAYQEWRSLPLIVLAGLR